jgi:hypothetical protein
MVSVEKEGYQTISKEINITNNWAKEEITISK